MKTSNLIKRSNTYFGYQSSQNLGNDRYGNSGLAFPMHDAAMLTSAYHRKPCKLTCHCQTVDVPTYLGMPDVEDTGIGGSNDFHVTPDVLPV